MTLKLKAVELNELKHRQQKVAKYIVKKAENVNQFLFTASKGKYGFKRKKRCKNIPSNTNNQLILLYTQQGGSLRQNSPILFQPNRKI